MAHVCSVRGWTDNEYEHFMQRAVAQQKRLEPWYDAEGADNWVMDATLLTRNGVPLDPNGEQRAKARILKYREADERQALLAENFD